jgi:hypothetical protein
MLSELGTASVSVLSEDSAATRRTRGVKGHTTVKEQFRSSIPRDRRPDSVCRLGRGRKLKSEVCSERQQQAGAGFEWRKS